MISYEPAKGHPFAHDPFKALVAPRPIGWISTLSASGAVNLAPYSYFNAVGDRPPMVMFSSTGWKDSVGNIAETGEFVCNIVGKAFAEAMNATSAPFPPDVNEFEAAGLEAEASMKVAPPRVKGIPAALECVAVRQFPLSDRLGQETGNHVVFGEVVAVHIDEAFMIGGRFDTARAGLLARCGYMDYAVADTLFQMGRPRV